MTITNLLMPCMANSMCTQGQCKLKKHIVTRWSKSETGSKHVVTTRFLTETRPDQMKNMLSISKTCKKPDLSNFQTCCHYMSLVRNETIATVNKAVTTWFLTTTKNGPTLKQTVRQKTCPILNHVATTTFLT